MALPNPVRKWLRYALDDLKVSRALESMGPSYQRACVYHCQQAAEKSIKAYLAYLEVRFTKTHDIAQLTAAVAAVDLVTAKKLLRAKRLTKYAVEYRYPDAANKPLTRAKVKAACLLAEDIYELLSHQMRKN